MFGLQYCLRVKSMIIIEILVQARLGHCQVTYPIQTHLTLNRDILYYKNFEEQII